MNFRIIRFLAWRYMTGVSFSSSINTMIKICALSMFVGTFSLALVTAIMRGFEQETYRKLKSIAPDIIISAPQNAPLDVEPLQHYLKDTYGTKIQAMAAYAEQTVALHKPHAEDMALIGFLKVIDPLQEAQMHTLDKKIQPSQPLSELLDASTIIVGKGMAQELQVKEGDTLTLVYNAESTTSITSGAHATRKNVTIAGLLNTGIAESDNHLIICSFECYKTLVTHPENTQLGILTNNIDELRPALATLDGLAISSWKDEYPALVSALKLERYAMIFLLSLITLVASMNLLSLIFMVTAYKKSDCALLLSLGLTKKELIAIFMVFSSIISLASSLVGITAAYIVARLMQAYPCLTLPDVYYVTHLPVEPYWVEFIGVLIGAFIISSCAALGALSTIRNVSLTHIFRFE